MKRILWLEDEFVNVPTLKRKLVKSNIEIVRCKSLEEFYKRINDNFNLVLVDLMVPKYNNYQKSDDIQAKKYPGLEAVNYLTDKGFSNVVVYSIIDDSTIVEDMSKHKIPFFLKTDSSNLIYNEIMERLTSE